MGAARVGKTLGNFRILECLGTGGAGMIWKAEDLGLGRIVALKALRPELAADGEMSERFRAEARTLARLSHANIASLYSLIEDEDGLFLVLEYVEGSTLAALLATSGPLPFDSAFALFHQVLDGVGHAHEAGIVHRDIKPANLMVDARGRVKVMDFGIARMAGVARTTHHGKLVGTPEYMSPEQVRGEDATIRSDIYSLGIVLYEMLTGRVPFRAPATFDLMRAQLEDAPEDPRVLRPDLDARVASALLRTLAKPPALRFATTRELQDCLLDAGAPRRGRTIVPVWNELPSPATSSEAPTLLTQGPAAPHAAATIDGEIDAAFAGVNEATPAADGARGGAHSTLVIDAAQDTAVLEPARPTRMIDDAPFAMHARVLGSEARAPRGAVRPTGLLFAGALLVALALAFGAVRLAQRPQQPAPIAVAEPVPSAAPEPEPAPSNQAAPAAEPEIAPPVAPDTKRARTEKKPAAARPSPGPQQEESGWVIRR